MADQKYPYTTVPGKMRDLLKKAPGIGKPSKVTVAWLKSAGWKSSNDSSIIPVLKFVGIVAADGTPTDLWDAVRVQDEPAKAKLADAIRKAYADLFSLYPDAHRKDAEALRNFFRANTSAGEQVQMKMVQSFQVLTEFADFDALVPEAGRAPQRTEHKGVQRNGSSTKARREEISLGAPGITLNVNIQLQLPATAEGEVYEKLFAAMRKHLMGITDRS
jgi:hypothetical protein